MEPELNPDRCLISPPPLRVSWFVWGLGALFYLMGFFQRVAPAVMTAELMGEFQIMDWTAPAGPVRTRSGAS